MWVCLMDRRAGFVLFSIAKGTTPDYVSCEPGTEHLKHLLGGGENGIGGGGPSVTEFKTPVPSAGNKEERSLPKS